MQRSTALPVFLVSIALVLGIGLWLDRALLPQLREQNRQLTELRDRTEQLEESLALLHFSAEIRGQPLERILEYLRHWTDRQDARRPSAIDEEVYEEKLRLGRLALAELGASVLPRLRVEFRDPANQTRIGYRLELMQVIREIDPKEAFAFYREILQSPGMDSRYRTTAARGLVDIDAQQAVGPLQSELLRSTKGGRVNPDPTKPQIRRAGFPGYDSLLEQYMRTPHSARLETLLRLLNSRDHEISTYVTIVRYLRELGDARAVPALKERFEQGLRRATDYMNPHFRRRCVEAIAELGGRESCEWLQDRLKRERDRTLATILANLIRKYCPR